MVTTASGTEAAAVGEYRMLARRCQLRAAVYDAGSQRAPEFPPRQQGDDFDGMNRIDRIDLNPVHPVHPVQTLSPKGAEMAALPVTRIAAVEAFVIVGDKDYVGAAGLRPPTDAGSAHRRALAAVGDRHICAYPPQAQSCVVKITAEDGTVGWGEGHAPLGPRATVAVVQDVLAPLLLGEDPLAIEMLWERMYGSMRLRGHVAGYQLEAIAGVDIALWDLAGKLTGLPAYRLLGGPFTTELPAYASGVPGQTVEERAASAERFIADGYTALKA